MFKFLIIAVAGFILYKLLVNDRTKKQQNQKKNKQDPKQAGKTGEMVKDPICGTYVPFDSDIRVRKDGQVYTFCSYDCMYEFLNSLYSDGENKKELQK